MLNNYDDIMHLTRPQYDEYPPMSMHDRAAQFSPFAALVGYGDEVAETARLTDSRIELTEDEIDQLNAELNRLLGMLGEEPEVRVISFVPDERKSGGSYAEKMGAVRTYDSCTNELVFTDGTRTAVADMYSLELIDEPPQAEN